MHLINQLTFNWLQQIPKQLLAFRGRCKNTRNTHCNKHTRKYTKYSVEITAQCSEIFAGNCRARDVRASSAELYRWVNEIDKFPSETKELWLSDFHTKKVAAPAPLLCNLPPSRGHRVRNPLVHKLSHGTLSYKFHYFITMGAKQGATNSWNLEHFHNGIWYKKYI